MPEVIFAHGVCAGCGARDAKIVTHHNKKRQGFCSRCNNLLRRRFGTRYGAILENPGAELQRLEETEQETKDRKRVRKKFFDVMNLIEDLEPEERRQVMFGFRNHFADLAEAQPFLTFDEDFPGVKSQTPQSDDPRLGDMPLSEVPTEEPPPALVAHIAPRPEHRNG